MTAEPTQTGVQPTATLQSRADGRGYIDDDGTAAQESAPVDNEESDGGSSVEEEIDSDWEGDYRGHPAGGWPLGDGDLLPSHEADGEVDDAEDDEDDEWGVENEDWELADGDFTKQYNRVRQSYAAASGPSAKSATAASTSVAQRPLPARNANIARPAKYAPASAGTVGKALVNPAIMLGGVAANPKSATDKLNQKDKADRATHEQVLDARTRLVLSALVNRGFFSVIEGVISTGKEANVYLAHPGPNPPPTPTPYPPTVAVKIYRTSILNFRSRKSYIEGEHRFKGGYTSAKNPRKMVRLWAEKELRNLRRLVAGGVRAPIVIEQRENVLVMEFLGSNSCDGAAATGSASPRLKDADISKSKLPRLYGELLVAMRRMYQHCHLVHADLSEYNILYHNSHLYIIDVSQSVEHEHPAAFDFLRSDIRNVEDWFQKKSNGAVRTLGIRRAWSFIVDEQVGGLTHDQEIGDEGEEKLLDVLREWLDKEPVPVTTTPGTEEVTADGCPTGMDAQASAASAAAVDDAVFLHSYIPRTLGEVYDPERDVELIQSGQADKLIYAGVTGLSLRDKGEGQGQGEDKSETAAKPSLKAKSEKSDPTVITSEPSPAEPSTSTSASASASQTAAPPIEGEPDAPEPPKPSKTVRFEDSDSADEEDDVDSAEQALKKSRGFRNEDKEANKERKKALKEEAREKRKNKMPKAEKKRLIKKASRV